MRGEELVFGAVLSLGAETRGRRPSLSVAVCDGRTRRTRLEWATNLSFSWTEGRALCTKRNQH